jgi:hypothetical protein
MLQDLVARDRQVWSPEVMELARRVLDQGDDAAIEMVYWLLSVERADHTADAVEAVEMAMAVLIRRGGLMQRSTT